MQKMSANDGTPDGCHRFWDATIAARNEGAAAIVDAANRSGHGPIQLSDFGIAPSRGDLDMLQRLQIGAVWRTPGKAADFRYSVPFLGIEPLDVSAEALNLIKAADEFVLLGRTSMELTEVRAAVEQALVSCRCDTPRPRLIGVGLSNRDFDGGHAVTVDVEMLGHDLTRGIERVVGSDLAEALHRLDAILSSHVARATKLAQAVSAGCRGWIDGAALGIFVRSGLVWREAVERLTNLQRLRFSFSDANGWDYTASLYWEDGIIWGACSRSDDEWSFEEFRFLMRNPGWPDTVLSALVGRLIGDVLQQPILPGDATITGLPSAPDGWLALDLAIAPVPIDLNLDRLPSRAPPERL